MTCCPTCGGDLGDVPATWDAERGIVVANGKFALLTGKEGAVFKALVDRWPGVVSKEQVHHALYGLDPDGGAEIKIVDVFVCKMRAKLRGMAVDITTHWGEGYALACEVRRADLLKEAA